MKEKIYDLVAQGVLTKKQADIVWSVVHKCEDDDREEMLISLSECV